VNRICVRISAILVVLVVALARTASAQLVNENLLIVVPPGYKLDYQNKKPNSLMNEMVPVGESVNDWTEMVTVQIFYNLKATPDQFEGTLAKGWIGACPGARAEPVASGPENGYPAGVWLLNCPKNPAVKGSGRTVDEISAVGRGLRFALARSRLSGDEELRSAVPTDGECPLPLPFASTIIPTNENDCWGVETCEGSSPHLRLRVWRFSVPPTPTLFPPAPSP
jgi:hypothetical protein